MANHFFISDLHLGHANILNFTQLDGVTPVRDFAHVDEMHDTMIKKWNAVVRQEDHVHILGDVVMNKAALPLLDEFNGHKRIILGNHDPFDSADYLKYVDKLYGVRVMKGAVFTHVPVHPASLNDRSWKVNVHGHLHNNFVQDAHGAPDPRYINVCCEVLNYTPISLEELREKIWALPFIEKSSCPLTFY